MDGEGFLEQIVTGDETWCHHFDPATKRMSQEWRHPGSPRPKKARSSATAGKVILTVFVDIHGPLLLEWMPVGATINAQCYCDTLQNLRRAIKNKWSGKLSRGVLMLHDNVCPHAAHATRDTLCRSGWGVLDHPPYSPDLSPCDYHVFGPLKKTLKGRWFNSDEAVREAVEQWFIQQPVSFFAEGITKLVQRWDKCLNSGGQYL
jgi:histone-lysine N-methyltransferase SETMAR